MRINHRVNEPNTTLPLGRSILVDNRHYTPERGTRGAGAVYQRKVPVDGDDVVGAVGRDVGEGAHGAGIVEAVAAVGRGMVEQERGYCGFLVGGEREDVAEAAAAVDYGFAGRFGLGFCGDDVRIVFHLGGADSGNEDRGGRESAKVFSKR